MRRRAHALLVAMVTLLAIAIGTVVISTMIPRDVLALLVSCSWASVVALLALAYYETRVKP
ncbi:hypothetical protein AVP41_00725 [Microbacterium sp. TNHR37B]|nr:hypothetical protein AVP41_00725 [Microbacterium sp. TNHR37B]